MSRPPAPMENARAAPEILPDAVVDAAIVWSVRLDYSEVDPHTLRTFEAWLRADRRHALAWERIGALKQDFAGLPPQPALKTLQTLGQRRRERGIGRRDAIKLFSLAGIAAAMGWGVREHTPWQRLFADASTAVGEQRALTLADGTAILLNTDSAISADLTGELRLVVLRRGEILIETGDDAGRSSRRPFWVHTPHGRLQALGTRFVVRLDERRARLAVLEGAVALTTDGGDAAQIVHTGESRWFTRGGTRIAEPDGFEIDAWADGVIAGKHIRLADLLAELERYRPGRIVCDERIAGLEVSGVFHIRNTDQALQFIQQTQPVDITYHTRYWVAVGPALQS